MDTTRTTRKGLMDLPPELRLKIYEHIFEDVKARIPFPLLRYARREIQVKHCRRSELGLLLTSRQIYREAFDVLCNAIRPCLEFYRGWCWSPFEGCSKISRIRSLLHGCYMLNKDFGSRLRLFKELTIEDCDSLTVFTADREAKALGFEDVAYLNVFGRLCNLETIRIRDGRFRFLREMISVDEPWLGIYVRTRRLYDNMMRAWPKLRTIVCDDGATKKQACRVEPEGDSWRVVCVDSGIAVEMEDWE